MATENISPRKGSVFLARERQKKEGDYLEEIEVGEEGERAQQPSPSLTRSPGVYGSRKRTIMHYWSRCRKQLCKLCSLSVMYHTG